MTAARIGDRVHVDAFDGDVVYLNPSGAVDIERYGIDTPISYVPVDLVTVVGRTLAVGDTLAAGDPEPPIGTVLTVETVDGQETYLHTALNPPGWVRAGDATFHTWTEIALSGDYITARHTPGKATQ